MFLNATCVSNLHFKKRRKKIPILHQKCDFYFKAIFYSSDWDGCVRAVQLSPRPPRCWGLTFPACVSNQPCRRAEEPAARSAGLELWFQSAGGRVSHAVRLTFSPTNNTCPAIHLSKSQPVSGAALGLRDGQQTEGELRSASVHRRFPPLFFFTPPASFWFTTLSPRTPTELKWLQWSFFLFSA